ncbi:MAG: hydroxyisourate hydrolase [Woeseiaceae bacterium]|nr:hydroxyisourate hydrolase [Woeseiaceae bacterium]NIP21873.1 hydroxyisourate hydrolase [Woeseiaceae bacterium]NIS90958.1 hydroxyisourate hydrolase [Woeseiaceae bacterium]
MGRLTTHVLDTANGIPASGVDIRLYALDGGRQLKAAAVTNDDGRSEHPLLADELLATGEYELEFDIGAYFRARSAELDDPAFLETVVIRFAMCDDEHYHVPLLVSPWSYSTYRGS